MMRIALAVPAYGDIKFATARSLWRLTSMLTAHDIVYDEIEHLNDPDVANARNAQMSAFLRGSASRLLSVDTDVAFDPADALRLVTSTLDYVGANYPRKKVHGGMASTPKDGGRRDGVFVEADLLATGLLSLSRAAVERLAAASNPYLTHDGWTAYEIANSGAVNGRWQSEDEAMCRRWQRLGEVAWIDESIQCNHIGQFTFTKETA